MRCKLKKDVPYKLLEKYGFEYNIEKKYYSRRPQCDSEVEMRIYKRTRLIEAVWYEDPLFRTYNVSGRTIIELMKKDGLIEEIK